jgi:hypothetical protein
MEFDDYENKRNVVGVSVGQFVFREVEDKELFNDDGDFLPEAYDLAVEMIDGFIGELKSKYKNILEDKMVFELDGNLKEYTSTDSSEKVLEMEDLDGLEEIYLFFVITKKLPADVLNSLFLDIDNGFYAIFESDNEGEIIIQGYHYGEYDTGFFSDWCEPSNYINQFVGSWRNYPGAVNKLTR